jgi:hypothetical protein
MAKKLSVDKGKFDANRMSTSSDVSGLLWLIVKDRNDSDSSGVAERMEMECKTDGNYRSSVDEPTIYHDDRLYGVNHALYGDPRKAEMRVPDQITDCVVFLGTSHGYQDIEQVGQ